MRATVLFWHINIIFWRCHADSSNALRPIITRVYGIFLVQTTIFFEKAESEFDQCENNSEYCYKSIGVTFVNENSAIKLRRKIELFVVLR